MIVMNWQRLEISRNTHIVNDFLQVPFLTSDLKNIGRKPFNTSRKLNLENKSTNKSSFQIPS